MLFKSLQNNQVLSNNIDFRIKRRLYCSFFFSVKHTSPEENFSTMAFILLRDMSFNPEWKPTKKSHFQNSKDFKLLRIHASALAIIILFTNIMHLVFSFNLRNKEKHIKYIPEYSRLQGLSMVTNKACNHLDIFYSCTIYLQ